MSAPAPSVFSPAAGAMAEELGLTMGRSNLEVFAEVLLDLAKKDPQIMAATSDSRGSGKLGAFGKQLPNQLIEVGIAEQNLVGIAAGLASTGKNVFAVSPACFLTARALEQIKNDVAYSDNPVRLVGISAGVSYGALGSTHHSLHDFAALRALNNLILVAPADNVETAWAVRAAAQCRHPVYLRFGKAAMYQLHREPMDFEMGKAVTLCDGSDVAFLATGEAVVHAYLAAANLERQGISCRVLSLHTVKPLDIEAILNAGRKCRAVVAVEEHMTHGGLGEGCAAVLLQAGVAKPFRLVAIPDEYTVTGSQADILRHYGISMEGLSETAKALINGR
jgi:transketolase